MRSPLLDMLTGGKPARFLTADEELECFRRWREDGDQAAHDTLVQSIAPFVLKMAGRYARKVGQEGDVEEYESYAIEGLLRAIEKFDAGFGVRLSTYAGHWVHQAMQRGFERDRVVYVPGDLVRSGQRANLPEKRTKAAAIALQPMIPLSGGSEFDDDPGQLQLVCPAAMPDDQVAEREELDRKRARVRDALDRLGSGRTRYVLVARVFEEKTLEEVGRELGITRERVRQIEQKGLGMMADILREDGGTRLEPIVSVHGGDGTRRAVERDPLALVEALQKMPLAELDAALRELEEERVAFHREYKRRRSLLLMTKKALSGRPTSKELKAHQSGTGVDYRRLTEEQVLSAMAKLQPASASKIAAELGVSPQGMGRRLANLKAAGKAARSIDGRWTLVGTTAKRKRSLAG